MLKYKSKVRLYLTFKFRELPLFKKGRYFMEEKKKAEANFESQMKDLGAKLDQLSEKVGKTAGEIKVQYKEQVEELKKGFDVAGERLKELKGTGGDAWGELKVGFEKAFHALKESFNAASSKFKDEGTPPPPPKTGSEEEGEK